MLACFLGERRSGLFDVGCLLSELSGLVFFLGDWQSGLERSSGGGMSGKLQSDESGSLGVFCHQYLERDWMWNLDKENS